MCGSITTSSEKSWLCGLNKVPVSVSLAFLSTTPISDMPAIMTLVFVFVLRGAPLAASGFESSALSTVQNLHLIGTYNYKINFKDFIQCTLDIIKKTKWPEK